jgi:hypothetical protein
VQLLERLITPHLAMVDMRSEADEGHSDRRVAIPYLPRQKRCSIKIRNSAEEMGGSVRDGEKALVTPLKATLDRASYPPASHFFSLRPQPAFRRPQMQATAASVSSLAPAPCHSTRVMPPALLPSAFSARLPRDAPSPSSSFSSAAGKWAQTIRGRGSLAVREVSSRET